MVGKSVQFGSFEQDGNLSNGAEELYWIVLAEENGNCLLLCKDVIYAMRYSDSTTGNDWEDSYVYDWLNQDFLASAFTPAQKRQLQQETLYSMYWGIEEEYDNEELVFLLSGQEIDYFSSITDERIYLCEPTAYAKQIDSSYLHDSDSHLPEYNGMAQFWVRPAGSYASIDGPTGGFELQGYGDTMHGVRPALWVKKAALQGN